MFLKKNFNCKIVFFEIKLLLSIVQFLSTYTHFSSHFVCGHIFQCIRVFAFFKIKYKYEDSCHKIKTRNKSPEISL